MEDTEGQGIPVDDAEIDDGVIIEEEEASPEEPQTDERGVPLKNVYAEVSRKLKAMEKKLEASNRQALAEKDRIINELHSRVRELEGSKNSPQEEFSTEDLYKALSEAKRRGDAELEGEILKQLFQRHSSEQDKKSQQQAKESATQAEYNAEAVALYRQYGIQDPGSEFYAAVAQEINRRTSKGIIGPSLVLDSANYVAFRRPDLVGGGKKMPSAQPGRRGGFSESGSGKPVTKSRSDDVQINETIFNKWKKDYPGLDRESLTKRMRAIKERTDWKLGDAI